MYQQDIEPIILVLWHIHPHAITPEFKMHTLVLDVSNTIEPQMRGSFTEENRAYCYASGLRFGICNWEVEFAHVV
jgi:hypothetical protein